MMKCPRCDFEILGAFRRGMKLFKHNPGDIAVCRFCAAIIIYDENLSPRIPTKEEFRKIRSDPETWRNTVRALIDAMKFLKKDI